jgi:O-acetyl-ADP-ribose deacetylase (regulator of RNase III)
VTSLTIISGDATQPTATRPKIIAHVCNDRGGWGRGFVAAVSRRWTAPEQAYRRWHHADDFGLGAVQLVAVAADLWVANMVAQHGYRTANNPNPIRYPALRSCLTVLAEHAQRLNATVHMPRIGTGLAGGSWELIEPLITATLLAAGVATTVYQLPEPGQ